jgi:hypothetical protein
MKEKLKFILDTLNNLKKEYNLDFDIRIVSGSDASIQPNNFINVGADFLNLISAEEISSLIYHEAFHQIFPELDETNEFKIKDETGNLVPYYKKELQTWNKVKEIFPELTSAVNSMILKLIPINLS